MTYDDAKRAANDALYAVARSARREGKEREAARWQDLARRSDALFEGRVE